MSTPEDAYCICESLRWACGIDPPANCNRGQWMWITWPEQSDVKAGPEGSVTSV